MKRIFLALVVGSVFSSAHPIPVVEWTPKTKALEFAANEIRKNGQSSVSVTIRINAKRAPESFQITTSGNRVTVEGGDIRGALFGALDVAEQLEISNRVVPKSAKPFLGVRMFKFNLPLTGSAYLSDEDLAHNAWFYDLEYWRAFMEMMAKNRYNAISFWSAHPYAHMVRLKKYPEACSLTDEELAKNKAFFHKLFGLAKEHGLDVFIVTWNTHVSEGMKKAHGVKDGQDTPLIKDYSKECIRELLAEYPELTGLGTCPGEAMPGSATQNMDWIRDVYLDTQKPAKPFILRYWGGEPKSTAKMLTDENYGAPVMLDIKYNGEHMYSAVKPHVLDSQWLNQKPRPYKMLWHLRNDCIFQLRWGDPEFAASVLRNCLKADGAGFVMGSEIEIPGEDRNHTPESSQHKTWKYEFEKNWMRFAVWGRMGYDPNESQELWIQRFGLRFGARASKDAYQALRASSKIIPLTTSFHWNYMNGDWYPEGNVGAWNTSFEKPMVNFRDGSMFHDILNWMFNQTIDDTLINPVEFSALRYSEQAVPKDRKSPWDVATELDTNANLAEKHRVAAAQALELGEKEWECTDLDLKASIALGHYYASKIRAASLLVDFVVTGSTSKQAQAVTELEAAQKHWAEIVAATQNHYVKHEVWLFGLFDWAMYRDAVAKDIEIAKTMEPWPVLKQTWVWNTGAKNEVITEHNASTWSIAHSRNASGAKQIQDWSRYFDGLVQKSLKAPQGARSAKVTLTFGERGFVMPQIFSDSIDSIRSGDQSLKDGLQMAVSQGLTTFEITFKKPPTTIPTSLVEFIPGVLFIEAESGQLTAPMQIDSKPIDGKRVSISVPLKSGRGEDQGKVLDNGKAVFKVVIPADGSYVLRARVWWANTSNNSLFINWDTLTPKVLGNDENYRKWHWVTSEPTILKKGEHELVIRNRDENSVLDCMVIQRVK